MNNILEMLIRRSHKVTPDPSDSSSSTGGIPTDYDFYASLSTKNTTSESGHTLSFPSGSSATVIDGVPCVSMLRSNISSSASITTNFNLTSNTKPFTISSWAWIAERNGDWGIWGVGQHQFRSSFLDSSWNYVLHTTIYESPLTGRIFASSNQPIQSWHHIVFEGDGEGHCYLYIDNELMGSSTYDGYSQDYNLLLGQAWGGNAFNGYIAAYRFYRRALTAEERDALYHEFDDKSDSSSSSDISDSSSSGSDSSSSTGSDLVFHAPFATDYSEIAGGRTLLTAGGNATNIAFVKEDGLDCCYIPTGAYIYTYETTGINTETNPITMSIWMKMKDPSTFDGAVFNYGRDQYGESAWLEIGRQQSSNKYFASLPSNNYFSQTPSSAGWHHLVMQWDGQYIYLYIDGVFDGKLDRSGCSITGTWIAFGTNYVGTAFQTQNCFIADARIYNQILTAQEVADLYQEGLPEESDSSDSSSSDVSDSSSIEVPIELPTDYRHRWELQSNLQEKNHPSNTDYNLTKSSSASGITYSTYGGMTGAVVPSGVCLYNQMYGAGISTNGGCLSFWAKCYNKPSTSGSLCVLCNMSKNEDNGFFVGYQNGKWVAGASSQSAYFFTSDVSINANWHNFVLNYDKDTLTYDLWIDGVKQATKTVTSSRAKNTGLTINAGSAASANPSDSPNVKVRYAYVTCFDRTLSDAEIRGLFHEFD